MKQAKPVCAYANSHTHTCKHMHAYIDTHAHTHKHIHTYIHTHAHILIWKGIKKEIVDQD